ncbi:MAG: hypothetical protein Fur0025_22070 [Oscillatoriaceae cyanobacterium]
MGRVIFLKIESDQATQETVISLQLCREGQLPSEIEGGRLALNPEIEDLYQSWRTSFGQLRQLRERGATRGPGDGWIINSSGVNQISINSDEQACRQLVRLAEDNVRNWLLSGGNQQWQKIRERLAIELANTTDELSIVLKIKPPHLAISKLPWLAWDLLDIHPEVGISFSFPEFEEAKPLPTPPLTPNLQREVRILAVLGNDKNINLEPDEQAIMALEGAAPHFLYQPSAKELIEALTDENGWDIFFFAGHSESELQTGRIYINDGESLAVEDFKNALKEAVSRRLKLGIFNSCDGLGLTRKLGELGMQAIVVMKEAVPDEIAQAFLKEFLGQYSGGKSLYSAVRIAQQRLEKFSQFPGATWLPIVCQNPTSMPPRWQQLGREIIEEEKETPPIPPRMKIWQQRRLVAATSIFVAVTVMAIRFWGILQPYELQAFDHLMRLLPPATNRDPRILVVLVSNDDIDRLKQPPEETGQRARSLSDRNLDLLLQIITNLQPRVIGFNISREGSVDGNQYPHLKSSFLADNFIATCYVKSPKFPDTQKSSYSPNEVTATRSGMDGQLLDGDEIVRRHGLIMTVKDKYPCKSNKVESFSLKIAQKFLEKERFTREDTWEDKDFIQIGSALFKQLYLHRGGYHRMDSDVEGGIQLMIRYRTFRDSTRSVVSTISLTDVFAGQLTPEQVKDKIVLIGLDKARANTPYGGEKMPEVLIHAQVVSQIISTVKGEQSLIWTWPWWGDTLWVWLWGLLGAIIVTAVNFSRQQRGIYLKLLLGVAFSLLLLDRLCLVLFIQGGWLPLIPSALSLMISGITIILVNEYRKRR